MCVGGLIVVNAVWLAALATRGSFFSVVGGLYRWNTVYGPVLMAISAIVVLRLRPSRAILRRAAFAMVVLAILAFGLRVWATHIEPRWLHVRSATLVSPKVEHPLRIVHLSDIQSDRVGAYEEKVVDVVRDLLPDLVVHG